MLNIKHRQPIRSKSDRIWQNWEDLEGHLDYNETDTTNLLLVFRSETLYITRQYVHLKSFRISNYRILVQSVRAK